jgi:hypothetical protein
LTRNYAAEAQTPILTESGAASKFFPTCLDWFMSGGLLFGWGSTGLTNDADPRAIRQVSMGSILGVFCGLGVSVFSKPLAILIGLGIFVLQVRLLFFSFKHCQALQEVKPQAQELYRLLV